MKIFDAMQRFFNSLGEYVKNFSNLFLIFLGAFLVVSVIVIIITSFAYECKLTKTIDRINHFFERNPRINDDNLVAFNNMMKANNVPKILRRQWQQFMLYREHPASYYMSFKHCVENPLRNSTYTQQMTIYKIISYVLVVLSLVVSIFMAVQSFNSNLVLQDVIIIPATLLVLYWLISMILNLIHSAISGDLFQNYQYFEINLDKAMLTLPEFVDYEVLFSQDEIRRGIPVLYAYLQKRAIQEQQELEKARLKSVDHEKFDFTAAGLDGSLVLDRAMHETENYTAQRKKYMQETERVNNEIAVLENNYREQTKEFQRQVQTSRETVENLKEQLEQATSTIEINYIKKQMRDEINRQQEAEKEFDILTDKHNQEMKNLLQEIKYYEDETKKAKEAMEVAMLSEFNTYSVKVYDNLEKIVDEKMQDKFDEYKEQIKGLETELEDKNEELENVYTRYQEALSQVPNEDDTMFMDDIDESVAKKGKKKKKSSKNNPSDDDFMQPEGQYDNLQFEDQYEDAQYQNYDESAYDQYDDESYNPEMYDQYDDQAYEQYDDQEYMSNDIDGEYQDYGYDNYDNYVSDNGEYAEQNYEYADQGTQDEYAGYIPLNDETDQNMNYIPLNDDNSQNADYVPLNEEVASNDEYVPMDEQSTYVPQYEETASVYEPQAEETKLTKDSSGDSAIENFNDADFDVDVNKKKSSTNKDFKDMSFNFDFDDSGKDSTDDGEFDLNKALGLYDDVPTIRNEEPKPTEENVEEDLEEDLEEDVEYEDETEEVEDVEEEFEEEDDFEELSAPRRKAGRPRKIVDEDDIKPRRSVGRPRKVVDEEDEMPKRKAGRPRKIVDEDDIKPKRSVGRPKKPKSEPEEKSTKQPGKRGRPRKEGGVKTETSTKTASKRGRPKKQTSNTAGDDKGVLGKPKRKAGRPRKS